MRATAYIPEKDALKIKRGGSARVYLGTFPDKVFSAKVSQVGFNITDKLTVTLPYREYFYTGSPLEPSVTVKDGPSGWVISRRLSDVRGSPMASGV